MTGLETGDEAPGFCLPNQNGEKVCLESLRGRWVVLYFYPKDNTKGCTLEAIDFTLNKTRIEGMGATVLGVSPDSVESHRGFCDKHGLNITLLSDPGHGVLEAYGVWRLKKMFGREFLGVVRSTFLVDPEGRIAHAWKRVRVADHVDAVIEKLAELKGA
ncbi:MAG: thioredoxin-dependent thiol peroxidase [Candidatus Bathyarchaeota archaeon]|nr:thioredoxin-dependent thiol peroxidase [Candidatus Bathyarchaeota archaeon]